MITALVNMFIAIGGFLLSGWLFGGEEYFIRRTENKHKERMAVIEAIKHKSEKKGK